MIWRIKGVGEFCEPQDYVWKDGKGPWTPLDSKYFGKIIAANFFPVGRWEDPYTKHRKWLEAIGVEKKDAEPKN